MIDNVHSLKNQSELLKQRLALYSYLHISLAFTSAIIPYTSDIFQPYFACKVTPFLLISHAKTEDVISWKIDFMQVQKENHSYDRYQSLLSFDIFQPYFVCKVNQLFRNNHKSRPHESMFFVNFATRLANFY